MTGAFTGLGALGSLAGVFLQRPTLIRAAARLGMIGGSVCGMVLAVILFNRQAESPAVRIVLWTLLSFQSPQPLAFEFGLEATWLKAALVGLAGLFFLMELSFVSRRKELLSDDARLARSLLYCAITSFSLSPNLAQSLLSWGAAGFLIRFLICPNLLIPTSLRSNNVENFERSRRFGSSDLAGKSSFALESQSLLTLSHVLQRITAMFERGWKAFGCDLPNWLAEQSEIIAQQSDSVQILAAHLGMFTVLLTWLAFG